MTEYAGDFGPQGAVAVPNSTLAETHWKVVSIQDKPVDAVELARAKAYVALAIPGNFETNSGIAGELAELNTFGLPLNSVSEFITKVNAVTIADVQRVAKKYLPVNRATIVVVGDLAKVKAGVEKLGLGSVTVMDAGSVAK